MRSATLLLVAVALVLTAGIGIASGAGSDPGHAELRAATSAAMEVHPDASATLLAACEPGERAVGGGLLVGGGDDGVEVLTTRRVVVAPQVSGWLVTVANGSGSERIATARAVCESA